MTENQQITQRLAAMAAELRNTRVSQDGWAKVLRRVTEDLQDLTDALEAGKIVAHVPEWLTRVKRCGIAELADSAIYYPHTNTTERRHERSAISRR